MEVCRKSSWLLTLLGVIFLAGALQGVQGEVEIDGPSETQCRPYIEKALRELEHVGAEDTDVGQSKEEAPTIDNSLDDEQRSTETTENENDTQDSKEEEDASNQVENEEETESKTEDSSDNEETENKDGNDTQDKEEEEAASKSESSETQGGKSEEDAPEAVPTEKGPEDSLEDATNEEPDNNDGTSAGASVETVEDTASKEEDRKDDHTNHSDDDASTETEQLNEDIKSSEDVETTQKGSKGDEEASTESSVEGIEENQDKEEASIEIAMDNKATDDESDDSKVQSEEKENDEENKSASATAAGSDEDNKSKDDDNEDDTNGANEHQDSSAMPDVTKSDENNQQEDREDELSTDQDDSGEENRNSEQSQETEDEVERSKRSVENSEEHESQIKEKNDDLKELKDEDSSVTDNESVETNEKSTEDENDEMKRSAEKTDEDNESGAKSAYPESSIANENSQESNEHVSKEEINTNDPQDNEKSEEKQEEQTDSNEKSENASNTVEDSTEDAPEEDLAIEVDVPANLRPREYVEQLLKIDREATKTEEIVDRISEITLRELKRLYENAIKPLETLYKYRDLSNRHYGDAEIFSKPLILFMGPWSGGKSTIINYLLNIEYNDTALRTGAEPSPAYFNLLMHGEEEEVLDGTQLAADYTFSGLQKFGQGLEERLRGIKLPSKLLEKVNIAEIPGILEVRKQVSRVFPFNDACQWFIDRADIIFLVYDPTKLDVGPETEAILDQLKGREYQTRIVLNKADQVKPEELMRVQGALIWNISPLMSSPQPPVMYTTSLWSRPYEQWAPIRLLQSQERAFLRDLRSAVDKRIENKIASARRFAVRVRNHAKMVDCYLTTYYNHKSIFGNKKQVADAIIEHPQDYHIYEGLSTLTNISRYDLPDPDVYKDFFRLNPLYEFQQLSATCTYFRGCPINKLDVAIAYDFPELVGKHKRLVEAALTESNQDQQAQGS